MHPSSKSGRSQRRPTLFSEEEKEEEKELDLVKTVRGFLLTDRAVLAGLSGKFNNNNNNNKSSKSAKITSASRKSRERVKTQEESFYDLVRISVSAHVYLSQWRAASWTSADLQAAVDLVFEFELNGLALHGKALWLLHMMLQYNVEPVDLRTERDLAQLLVQTLFEVSFSQVAHNQSIASLRLLLQPPYSFSPSDLFAHGAALISRLPDLVEDLNFIALMHFANECVQQDPQSAHDATALLLALSDRLLCDIKSNYFLPRCNDLLETGLALRKGALSSQDNDPWPLSVSVPLSAESLFEEEGVAEAEGEGEEEESEYNKPRGEREMRCFAPILSPKTFSLSVALLRTIATRHPPNCEYLGRCSLVLDRLLEYLLRSPDARKDGEELVDAEWDESIATQCVWLLHTLAASLVYLRPALRERLSLSRCVCIARRGHVQVNAALVDLYLTLYEDLLAYCDESGRYLITGDREHERVVSAFFRPTVQRLLTLCATLPRPPCASSSSFGQNNCSNNSSSSNSTAEDASFFASLSASTAREIVRLIDALHRMLLHLEVSFALASDPCLLVEMKQDVLVVFHALLGCDPRRWDLRFVRLLDVLVLLGSGAETMWARPALHPVDRGFLDISSQLVAQFVSLTSEKIFDAKDRNTLHYLAGSDNLSTIPGIIARCTTVEDEEKDNEKEKDIKEREGEGEEEEEAMRESVSHSSFSPPSRSRESSGSLSLRVPRRVLSSHHNNTLNTTCESDVLTGSSLSRSPSLHLSLPPSPMRKTRSRGHSASSLPLVEQYLQDWRELLLSLLPHISFIEHIVSDWFVDSSLRNFRRLCFLFLSAKLLGVAHVVPSIQQSSKLPDLLWKIVPHAQEETDAMAAIGCDVLFALGLPEKCLQVMELFLSAQHAITSAGEENGEVPDWAKSNFEGHVAVSEWLTGQVLLQRPNAWLRRCRRAQDAARRDGEHTIFKEVEGEESEDTGEAVARRREREDALLRLSASPGERRFLPERERASLHNDDRPGTFQSFGSAAAEESENILFFAMMTAALRDEQESEGEQDVPYFSLSHAPPSLSFHTHHAALQILYTLSLTNRTVRRKLVASVAAIIDSLQGLAPAHPVTAQPLLHLVRSMTEFVPKLELNTEEAIVGLLIRSLSSPRLYVQTQACDLIYCIGQESPGFIFRGVSRREIEDPLLSLFVRQREHYECIRQQRTLRKSRNNPTTQHTQEPHAHGQRDREEDSEEEEYVVQPYALLLLNALKACTVLVHNFNVKPIWLPSPWLYHWQYYSPTLATRDLMSVRGLSTIISALEHAAVPYRLAYFLYSLSLTSSIMYAFSDGMLTATNEEDAEQLKALKNLLVQHALPWLPIAIDFIMLGKRKRERRTDNNSSKHNKYFGNDIIDNKYYSKTASDATVSSSSSRANSSSTAAAEEILRPHSVLPCCAFLRVDTNTTSENGIGKDKSRRKEKEKEAVSVNVDSTALHEYLRVQHLSDWKTRKINKEKTTTPEGVDLYVFDNMYRLKAVEILTERTVEAIYAFLCTDDMFPLSTYLQHIHLFQTTSLVPSVAYFMTEYRDNGLILRRGLDFIKYFAEYQMSVSAIAMHTPLALILAYSFHKDVHDVQMSFVKIVLVIVRSHDDFAKENLIRFHVHNVLVDLVRVHQSELTRLSIQAIMELVFNENHSLIVQDLGGLVEALAGVLSDMPKDLKCQCEAVRALATIDHFLPHLVSESNKKSALWPSLRKARKFMLEEQKRLPSSLHRDPSRNPPAERRRSAPSIVGKSSRSPQKQQLNVELNGDLVKEDIDVLLNCDLWKKEKCTIS